MSRPRFHLAIPVADLGACRTFYGEVMGFAEGRSAEHWVDFDVYGHQLVIHHVERSRALAGRNPVDGEEVPVPHFGVLLEPGDWQKLAARLSDAGIEFIIEPQVRFAGQVGEQQTMFFRDPSGNALEFKAFADDSQVFAT